MTFPAAVRGGRGEPPRCPTKDGPSPIVPEAKELAWSFGAFIVFAVLMRLVLFPRVKRGMDDRYSSIRTDTRRLRHGAGLGARRGRGVRGAARVGAAPRRNGRVDAARRTLEGERDERLAEVNAGDRRTPSGGAGQPTPLERVAVQGDVESAAADVVARTVELAIGHVRRPDVVRQAVSASMIEGASR